MEQNNLTYVRKDFPQFVHKLGFTLIGIGLFFGIISLLVDFHHGLFMYLLTFVFLLSIAIGSLFLVALEYVAGADWSTPIRRVAEFFASLIPVLFILAVPLLFNIKTIFHWADTTLVASDKILQSKSPYLNTTFFSIRVIAILGVWSLFYSLLTRNSRRQDTTGDQLLTKRNIKISAIFIPVFAITITLTAVDWMMSLEPHWSSTIFGIYFFAGCVLAGLSAVAFTTILLKEHGYLHPAMSEDSYFSLGALLFAFINFWGYIAFSQYLLMWYANLPEETFWFLSRWQGGWILISLALIVIHFLVPYFVLLSQPSKMNPQRLKFASLWILFAHIVDCYWLILPNLHLEKFNIFSIILQFAFPTAAIGVLIIVISYNAKKHNLVPIGDPKLQKGLNFRL